MAGVMQPPAAAAGQSAAAAAAAAAGGGNSRAETGFYCSTSGTYFSDKESLAEHYKSDFHRYNLKRKVAGLPPVTREWFEARKAQLTSASASPHARIWVDPLTKKKFQTQQTYQAHINSKRYQQLVRESGQPAPAPIILIKQQQPQQQQAQRQAADAAAAAAAAAPAGSDPSAGSKSSSKPAAAAGYTAKAPARRSAADGADDADDADEASSGWETASESELDNEEGQQQQQDGDEEEWEAWDPCVSLFDNKRSASMQDSLAYMYRAFGFYLPDAEYLADPEGLIKYLGAKLRYGRVPLYSAGDDPNARQFRSLHAVQRHMVDRNQCRMLYDGNEEEYEDFYSYSDAGSDDGDQDTAAAEGGAGGEQLALALNSLSLGNGGGGAGGGWELAVPGAGGGGAGGKVLGSREFARYYRQRPRPADTRQSVAVNTVIAAYRSLGVATKDAGKPPPAERAAQRAAQNDAKRQQQRLWMRNNVNHNLPKNVPY